MGNGLMGGLAFDPSIWVIEYDKDQGLNQHYECMQVGHLVFTRKNYENLEMASFMVGFDGDRFCVERMDGKTDLKLKYFVIESSASCEMFRLFKKLAFNYINTDVWEYLGLSMDEDRERFGDDMLETVSYWSQKFEQMKSRFHIFEDKSNE